jgi:hypothetical protein
LTNRPRRNECNQRQQEYWQRIISIVHNSAHFWLAHWQAIYEKKPDGIASGLPSLT